MIKTNNYSFLKYLNDYDLITKYNLKSIYLVPHLNQITLTISIEQNFAVKLKAQYKAFLFYYLYNFCCSKIILNFFTSLKKRVKIMTLKSQITIDIAHKKLFEFLILLAFYFNNKALSNICTYSVAKINSNNGKPHYEHLHLVFSTPAILFLNKTSQTQQSFSFNDLTVFFKCSIKNSNTLLLLNFFDLKNTKRLHINLFKNIFIFWALKV